MSDKHPIVISDSESDTLSESDRPCHTHASRANAAECNNQSHHAHKHATPSNALIASQDSSQTQPSCADATSSVASTSAAGFLSLLPDRRQLELDRMQRASKRKRQLNLPCSSSDDETQSDTKQCKLNNASVASTASTASQPLAVLRPSANPRTSTCVGEPSSSSKPQNSSYSMAADAITASSRFWHGSVKHGYNRYAAPSVSGVSISQMLLPATPSSRSSLELAVLATYDLRIDWLYSLFPRQLPVTLVLPPPKEDYRVNEHVARPGLHPSHIFGGDFTRCPGWQICVPNKPKGGWLTQHIKFLILVHQRFLRVAILSGNLNAIDWDRIENTAYIQDFPLLGQASMINHGSGSSSGSKSSQNDFKSQLVRVLRSLSMPASHAVYAALDRYDFSLATRARIVASWPEAASLREWDQIETQGLGRLGKVVRDLGIKESVELECQGSSLANHDVKWIEHFHLLASGVEPRGLLPLKGKPNEVHPEYASAIGATSKGNALPPVKIVFPSHRYVHETTVEGAMGALSFFGKAEAWSNSPIKPLYHSPQSRRGDVMIHAKSILALTVEGKAIVDKAFIDASDSYISAKATRFSVTDGSWTGPRQAEHPIGWTYLGSSNFTRAAHGNIGGSVNKPTMSSMNWELGVVLPIYASEVQKMGVQAESLRAVVYHRPLQAYARDDAPWDNREYLS